MCVFFRKERSRDLGTESFSQCSSVGHGFPNKAQDLPTLGLSPRMNLNKMNNSSFSKRDNLILLEAFESGEMATCAFGAGLRTIKRLPCTQKDSKT